MVCFNTHEGVTQSGGFCTSPKFFNKGKIRPQLRDTYSKLNVGKIYPSGHDSMCVLAKEN